MSWTGSSEQSTDGRVFKRPTHPNKVDSLVLFEYYSFKLLDLF